VSYNLLNSSPEAEYLLVQLYDKHRMYGLAKDRDPRARGELTDIMSDLLKVQLNLTETELVVDVLVSLVKQAEKDLRKAIAHKLSVMDDAPLRLVLFLANDEIEVATPILKHSMVLNDMDLVYIVKSKTPEYWQVIAERANMAPFLVDALAETKDLITAITLTGNKSIELTDNAMSLLGDMAKANDTLARPLLMREEITHALVKDIYNFVGDSLKEHIRNNFDLKSVEFFNNTFNYVKEELMAAKENNFTVHPEMVKTAEAHLAKKTLNTRTMLDYLKRGQIATFMACLSVYCGLSVKTVENMLRQNSAQGLAIVCRAMEVQKTDFTNMFLLTSRLRGDRMVAHTELEKAIRYYDKITYEMARSIVKASRQ
jgi:uncharacterized protein (DUF2336 family)